MTRLNMKTQLILVVIGDNMTKIYLSTFRDPEVFGGNVTMVSHGINEDTLMDIPMPQEPLEYYINECGAKCDNFYEWYIEGEDYVNN